MEQCLSSQEIPGETAISYKAVKRLVQTECWRLRDRMIRGNLGVHEKRQRKILGKGDSRVLSKGINWANSREEGQEGHSRKKKYHESRHMPQFHLGYYSNSLLPKYNSSGRKCQKQSSQSTAGQSVHHALNIVLIKEHLDTELLCIHFIYICVYTYMCACLFHVAFNKNQVTMFYLLLNFIYY